jgi:hypothetical protein
MLTAKIKLASAFCWISGLLGSIIVVAYLQSVFGEKFEYPSPSFFKKPGLIYLFFSAGTAWALTNNSKTLRFAGAWILLSLIAGVCFYPFLFCGQSFITTNFLSADWAYPFSQTQPPAKLVNPEPHDSFMMYFPYKYFWAESIQQNFSFPFWDFSRNSGMPFTAATLTGAFYPLNAFFLLTSAEIAWGFVGLLHLLIAGVGMFLLVDRLTRSRFAALYGSIGFMLMPLLAGWSRGVVWNSTGVWLPLACYFLFDALIKRKISYAGRAAVALAIIILGGWIQWAIYIYLLLAIFTFQYIAIQILRKKFRTAITTAAIASGLALSAILLSIVHLGPLTEVTALQPRTNVPWREILSIKTIYGSASNLAYLVPNLFGNYVDGNGVAPGWSFVEHQRYLGVFCLPLVILAFARRKTAAIAFFLIVPCIIFLSVSQLGVAYKILYGLVPGFDAIPTQQIRAIFIVEFILLLIAALGAANLSKIIAHKRRIVTASSIACSVIYAAVALTISNDCIAPSLPNDLKHEGIIQSIKISVLFATISVLTSIIPEIKSRHRLNIAIQAVVFIFSSLELIILHCKIASFSKPLSQQTPAIVKEIKETGYNRIFRTGGLPPTYAFIQNSAALMYGIGDTMAHDSIYLANYAKFFSLFNVESNFSNPHAILPPKTIDLGNVELIRMLNVDYIFHRELVTGTKVDPSSFDTNLFNYLRLDSGRHVLRLKEPLPRAFFVEHVEYLPENELIRALRAPTFKSTKIAFVNRPIKGTKNLSRAENSTSPLESDYVEYREQGANSFTLTYKSDRSRKLFISNVMYPGWKAVTESGDALEIYEANLAFMLIEVPPSNHGMVIFTFRPSNFNLYICISLIALTAIVLTQLSIFNDNTIFFGSGTPKDPAGTCPCPAGPTIVH